MSMNQDRYRGLLDDLRAESEELGEALFELTDEQWSTDTPALGWNIHDQILHLAFFDELAGLALTRPDDFAVTATELAAPGADWVDQISHSRASMPPGELLDLFGRSRSALLATFTEVDPTRRSPWFGPDMSAASSATARLMETWAHSQDIHDAIGITRLPSQRVRHICHLGVLTRDFSYRINDLRPPADDMRVELVSPAGQLWTWGPDDAVDRITGDAWDFALVVTQRRVFTACNLQVTSGPAAQWLAIAQAFAGQSSRRRSSPQVS